MCVFNIEQNRTSHCHLFFTVQKVPEEAHGNSSSILLTHFISSLSSFLVKAVTSQSDIIEVKRNKISIYSYIQPHTFIYVYKISEKNKKVK